MFEIINDVERYPQFVPGCNAATVLEKTAQQLRARLTVGSGWLQTSFVTRNQLTPHSCIRMELEEGPLRSLDGVWQLTPILAPDTGREIGCRVEIQLCFELNGGISGLAVGPLIERTVGALVDAFVEQARQSPAASGQSGAGV